jgi:chromosome segregation ATPase
MEKLFVTASLITVTVLSLAFSPAPVKKGAIDKNIYRQKVGIESFHLNSSDHSSIDTLPSKPGKRQSGVQTIEITKNEKRYEIVQRNGEISELKINGKEIPEDKFESYKLEIKPILEEVEEQQEHAEIQREEAEVHRKEADIHRDEANKLKMEAEGIRKQTDELRVQSEELRKNAEAIRIDAEKQRKKPDEFRYNSSNNKNYSENLNKNELYVKANEDFSKNIEDLKRQAELIKKDGEHSRQQAGEMREQAGIMRKKADEMHAKADVTRKEAEKMRAEYEKMQSELINDLIKEGVIKNQDNLSYKLNGEELIVNGVKQSEQLHSGLKAKYVKDQDVEMVYNWKGKTGYTTSGMIYK